MYWLPAGLCAERVTYGRTGVLRYERGPVGQGVKVGYMRRTESVRSL